MIPAPGDRWQRFVGDRVRFRLQDREGRPPAKGWRALLRTNLGRAEQLRREILQAHTRGLPLAGASWRDVPMIEEAQGWSLELPLAEPGYFKAKAYLLDPRGWQHWPEGPDVGITVHPDRYRTANILYCAFPRLFGLSKTARSTQDEKLARTLTPLDQDGYTVIPPSGKLRDLTRTLPHILDTLGCRILHLLPINPTPTTAARFGRFGSPYAALDLTAIDPALVVFDKRTTGVDQFRELTYETHLRGGRVFLDIVINHTGWGSVLQENHPEWFKRQPDGTFVSPGAWGTTWEDLVELRHRNVALWDELSEVFLTWCRRGVDGFRCDAGYMVPVPAWQYIVARVQQEYPETIFLLEGLGGAWEATEALLTEGGMQWAYSELFQNYSGIQVAGYLDHALKQSQRVGLLVHYSETHDNERLAGRSRAWSLLRNRLCALAGVSGGFGFTCGVEWLATEKIRVHGCTGLAWDAGDNLVPELARLGHLLADHPCFFDGAQLTRLSAEDSPVYVLQRDSLEGKDTVLVLVNTDPGRANKVTVQGPKSKVQSQVRSWVDLLGQEGPKVESGKGNSLVLTLGPGAAHCLAPASTPRGLHGDEYRRARAQAAWALTAINHVLPEASLGGLDWQALAATVDRSPAGFLAGISELANQPDLREIPASLLAPTASSSSSSKTPPFYPRVVTWTLLDLHRVTPVPPAHWLLLQDTVPFRASLQTETSGASGSSERLPTLNVESIPAAGGHIACFAPRETAADATLWLERYTDRDQHLQAPIRFLPAEPALAHHALAAPKRSGGGPRITDLVLLTNGRGGMARLCVDLGRVLSKYDCVLGANLHPTLPVDRHVLVKRIRVWVNADGFISPLDLQSLASFEPGPPALWHFVANAGDGRTVEIQMAASMLDGRNTTVFHFSRPTAAQAIGKQLPPEADVRLTVRLDLEDRNFHWETKRNGGAEYHFASHIQPLEPVGRRSPTRREPENHDRARLETGAPASAGLNVGHSTTHPGNAVPPKPAEAGAPAGFAFTPAPDRQLRVYADSGCYHPQPEWSESIPHPVEQSRGQTGNGDAYSPGWFELPLPKGATVTLIVTADPTDPPPPELETCPGHLSDSRVTHHASRKAPSLLTSAPTTAEDPFTQHLLRAVRAFVVRRDSGKTVIAGYPWFLDWGRDSFICARGLLAAGMLEEVEQLLLTFARFEKDGTLPNTIFGEDASNRDTSDAPLWFGLCCEELAEGRGARGEGRGTEGSPSTLDPRPSVFTPVLESIARNYIRGTPNGIRMDPDSALIWSPSHFTWMDTNYPAGTPREGYPVEIQALWIRLLRHLARLAGPTERDRWNGLAAQALTSFERLFWREDRGYYADVLVGRAGQAAAAAVVDDALRSNCLLAISLGLAGGERARRCVEAARRYLVVPGALRTLAPLSVSMPLPIYGNEGRLLNNPREPYWGHYEGDEDTRRKPAYHNGTAWTWTLPGFCEALARAWDFAPPAVAAARAYLGSMARFMTEGCLGQLPEILDGDAPHTARGCDAQAWGATEALRVWQLLRPPGPPSSSCP